MSIWMDMTNSMHTWSGGVVGIVRAELEIAKNMYRQSKDIRFVKFTGQNFEEIPAEDLSWLWEAESVGDAYLKAMDRTQLAGLAEDKKNNGDECLSKEQLIAKHPHLQNAFNYSSSRLYRLEWGLLLYCNSMSNGIGSFLKKFISAIFYLPKKAANARGNARSKRLARKALKESRKNASNQNNAEFKHPFKDGDTVFSCGWMFSGKEEAFEKVKSEINIFLSYLVYDIIILRKNTAQFYGTNMQENFRNYLNWISMHCDAVLYGGKTAMEDTREYQKQNNLPVPEGYPVYFGSDIIKQQEIDIKKWESFKESVGLERDYIMIVGSMDDRKNYSTIYRAFTILADRKYKKIPQLVIVGKGGACIELRHTIQTDPRTKDTILFAAPSDEELDWLYQGAKFVLLASAWEGWSLTLPEALQYGKMVICSDVAPLREIGGSLVDYADTYDPFEWADKITYYMDNPEKLRACEQKIVRDFKKIGWADCGKQIYDILGKFDTAEKLDSMPTLYIDITLTWVTALMGGNITGILRTELMMIKNLYNKYPRIRFFALNDIWGYQPIDVSCLEDIITGDALDNDFKACKSKIQNNLHLGTDESEKNDSFEEKLKSKQEAYWFLISILSPKRIPKMIEYGKKKKKKMISDVQTNRTDNSRAAEVNGIYNMPIKAGDVVFTAGTGCGSDTYAKLLREKKEKGFRFCGIIYDYTPILVPQTHKKETIEHYTPFLEYCSKMCDMILYGGETAQKDGIRYQKEHSQRIPKSYAIKFGSDISKKEPDDSIDQKKILKELGIKKGYIMAVGTMEQRKNYETLYRAYLRMLENYGYDDIPQMVFCGHPGWNSNEFITTISRDERVKGKILMLTPTDEQLDILYRNCEFTVLASLYEGWSLTLPESMYYNKFCICCDTPALKETAGELSEYIHGWDEKKWSERIHFYHTHPEEVEKREKMIKENWHSISWDECAEDVMGHLKELLEKK